MNTTILQENNIIFSLDLSEKYLNMTYYQNNATDSNNISSVPVNFDIEVDGKEFMTTIIDTLDTLNTTLHHITNETMDDFFTDLTEFKKNLEELAEYKEQFLIEEAEVNSEDLDKIDVITEEVGEHDIEVYDEEEHIEDEHIEGEHLDEGHADVEHADEEHADEEHADEEHADEEHADEEHADEEHYDEEHFDEEHFDGDHSEEEHFDGDHSEEEHIEEHFDGEYSNEDQTTFSNLEYKPEININHPDFSSFDQEVSRLLNEKYNHLYDDIYIGNQMQDPINDSPQKIVDNSSNYKEPPIYPFIILIVFIILYLIGYRRMELLRNRTMTV